MTTPMTMRLASALLPLVLPTITFAAGTPCEKLTAMTIPKVVIRSSSMVAAGPFRAPGARADLTLPTFCRIEAVAHPVPDSEIEFEVWIPPAADWNGKFQGVGNGGYVGAVSYPPWRRHSVAATRPLATTPDT